MSLAANTDFSKLNMIALKNIFNKGSNSDELSTGEGLTKDDFEKLEAILVKEVSESQTKQIINSLQGFRKGASLEEIKNTSVSPTLTFNQVINYINCIFFPIYR